ncbi:cap-specific mRNA (nucleoside-2'-O-)-methyltransferase 1 [Ostrinia nubilalis]|uniref:cap-specific mRNA (nucleoside-2'-O-)-methyltransferase 1 n=1 Tax=Ostrinia nubilalis TaxID=29057 RepID=UPI0030822044
MNLSDPSGDEDSSGEDFVPVPAKRLRADTFGASSTTSQGSGIPESDDDSAAETPTGEYTEGQNTGHKPNYAEQSPQGSARVNRSSLSENCSSPNDHYDDYRPGFDDNDQGETSMRPSFQDNESTFYNRDPTKGNEMDGAFSMDYSEKSKRMMSSMGYKPGKGLGKFEHGRIEPVEASTQKGRRGLGLKPSVLGEVPADFKWSPDDLKPEAKEEPVWIPSPPDDPLLGDQLEEWLQKGPKKLTIDDETLFVEPHILKGILDSKTIFDTLYDEDLRHARFRSNPYETIGSVIFLNRAAVKMANIDAVFDFMFTKPKNPDGSNAIDKKDILYFADVCAGPGGFSEYVLYRKGWKSKGFGFTLKGPCDFKLSDFYAGTPETFDAYYGIKNDGNIFDPENLTSLKDYVLKQTNDKGVHFLMADGGFSVEGQENIQEILSKQLYLCQCLAALMLVRTGGHFVVKLFDVFTMFSVGLIYIMYRCFDQVCLHKPVTSRPANSERYLICKWKRLGTESAERHLYNVNSLLYDGLDNEDDVTELVPLSVMQEDTKFFEYIYKSNCVLGEQQIKNLLKIAAFSKDKNLKETSQASMREQCLKLWQLPDKVRTQPERHGPDDTLKSILSLLEKKPPQFSSHHGFKTTILNKQPLYIKKPSDLETLKQVYDWHFMFLSSAKENSPDLKIFIGCGGKHVHQLEGSVWKIVVDLQLTLPAKTLIYAEILKEYRGEGNTQIYSKALHIVDALMLGGVDISNLPLTERINQCNLFCTALNKPFYGSQALPIRCKRLFNLEMFTNAMNKLEYRAMKRIKRAVTINTPNRIDGAEMFYEVGSLLFMKEIKEPWVSQISKTTGCKYYYNIKHRRSEYYITDDARVDMVTAFTTRLQWVWGNAGAAILEDQVHNGLSKAAFEDFIAFNAKR